ncbi:MAG: OmpA family protein [Amylibacter sp.]|nr:OmpA family protein [Amylibacter sp.]
MWRTALLTAAISFVLATALAVFSAAKLVDHVERHTERQLITLLNGAGESWATVRADGFQVIVGGLAENEATRFRTLQLISGNINEGRVYDRTNVSQPDGLQPPKFSLEILRNVERVSLIGLIPTSTGREYILELVRNLNTDTEVTDMLEQADFPAPEGWKEAIDFGLSRLKQVPRSKISVTPKRVKVTAVSDTPEEQQSLQKSLAMNKPEMLKLILDISAPRPVITPFLFRLKVLDGQGVLEACSADTSFAGAKITRALYRVKLNGKIPCQVGLGVPTTEWNTAVIHSIEAMQSIGSGTITLSDSDISLIASEDVPQKTFDAAVGKLENALPKLFSLQAILTPKPLIDGQTGEIILPDFTATKSPEGLVQMRGRLPDQLRKDTVSAYAASLFGKDNIYNQTRIVENLPDGWTVRSMAGLEALSHMRNGSMVVLPEEVILKGRSAKEDISSIISRIFATRVGTNANYTVDVKFDENLVAKPVKDLGISEQDCEKLITAVLGASKINFAPSSASIEAASLGIIDSIAEILIECPDAYFEISGHTDSQGSEGTNATLSQGRADAVLGALLNRRVLTAKMVSKGYGETMPIADNSTEEGRAQNRRIEFKLITKETDDG